MLSSIARPLIALAMIFGALADGQAIGPLRVPEARAQPRRLDVPYVPTPVEVVAKMLELAAPVPDDFLIDLGCGDGRIPVTAAKTYGTRGFGVDINPERIKEARANAEKNGVTDKVTFVEGDLFKTDISKATVLTLYLLPSVNLRLRPRILNELKPGSRVVSHDFDMDDWIPDRTEHVGFKTIYYWVVPAKVDGSWQVTMNDGSFTLDVAQDFQDFKAVATLESQKTPVTDGKLKGAQVTFTAKLRDGAPRKFIGQVSGDTMSGEGWSAQRRS